MTSNVHPDGAAAFYTDTSLGPESYDHLYGAASDAAVAFYERALEFDSRDDLDRPNGVWRMGRVEAAELAKLAETTYRDINIAFANELASYAEEVGIDVHLVIGAANSQPFSHIHRPGVAVGGHCIPVYPWLYLAGDTAAARRATLTSIQAAGRLKNCAANAAFVDTATSSPTR